MTSTSTATDLLRRFLPDRILGPVEPLLLSYLIISRVSGSSSILGLFPGVFAVLPPVMPSNTYTAIPEIAVTAASSVSNSTAIPEHTAVTTSMFLNSTVGNHCRLSFASFTAATVLAYTNTAWNNANGITASVGELFINVSAPTSANSGRPILLFTLIMSCIRLIVVAGFILVRHAVFHRSASFLYRVRSVGADSFQHVYRQHTHTYQKLDWCFLDLHAILLPCLIRKQRTT